MLSSRTFDGARIAGSIPTLKNRTSGPQVHRIELVRQRGVDDLIDLGDEGSRAAGSRRPRPQALVQLAAEEPVIQAPRDLIHVRIPLLDGPGNRAEFLTLAIRTVAALLTLRVPTLVCCGAGMSRSRASRPPRWR